MIRIDAAEPRPVTAGPPGLPDLVGAMLQMARGVPDFATLAMQGKDAVPPGRWRELGRLYVELGQACLSTADTVEAHVIEGTAS